jgi:hypothetical protein
VFFPKVTVELVLAAIDQNVPVGRRALILHDGYDAIASASGAARVARVLDVRSEPVTALDALPAEDIVIYACTQDDLGLPFVERMHELGRRYFPVWAARPGGYAYGNSVARAVLEDEFARQEEAGFAKWDFGHQDFENLIQAVEVTKELDGCYLEVGCYRGSSAGVVLRYLAATGRSMHAWFLDVFDGFSYPESARSADAIWAGTHVTEGMPVVRERILGYGRDAPGLRISVERCNILTDPLPEEVVSRGIAVANLDVDLHEAVLAGLRKVGPHVVPGGILIAEDPGHCPLLIGARLALEKFLREPLGKQFTPIAMRSGQTFLVRK